MAEVLSTSNLCLHCSSHLSVSNSKNRSSPSMIRFSTSVPHFRSLKSSFHGREIVVPEHQTKFNSQNPQIQVHMSLCFSKALKWWEKGLHSNMKEVKSAEDLVDSLSNAGNKLVIVDFFSPGCGGCKALHPKICQFAEMNPDAQFLQVNYEEHKSMCYSLNVHVLPFFRFYRGAQGRLCSFSCTNATVKKFKDALAKHSTDRCSLGPAKGLEESELMALAANKELSFSYPRKGIPVPAMDPQDLAPVTIKATPSSSPQKAIQDSEERELVVARR